MPLTDLEQKFYDGTFAMEFKSPVSSWMSYIEDKTSTIGLATSLDIDQVTTAAAVNDYKPAGTPPIAATQYADAEKATLTMTDWKYTSVGVKAYQQAHSRTNLLSPMATDAARAAGHEYNKVLYARMGTRVTTDIGARRDADVISVASAAFDSAATRKELVEKLQIMQTLFNRDGMNLPLMAVCSDEIHLQLAKYFLFDNPVVGTGQANDAAWVNGLVRNMFGLELVYDVLNSGDHSSAGTGQYPIYVFPRNYGIAGAMRTVANREIEVEDDFESRVQTLLRWGAVVYDPSVIREINYTIT